MSYQPPPPPPPPPPGSWSSPSTSPSTAAPSPPPPPAPVSSGSRRGSPLLVVGLALIVAGIAAAVAGVLVGGSRYEDAVKKLARAPVGCTTTLQFDKGGTYRLYLETKGQLPDLGGDCGAGGSFQHDGAAPSIDELTLVNTAGDEQRLVDASGKSYDAGGSKGAEIRTVELADAGTYRLTVNSADTDFAVAVGKDPKSDGESLRNLGIGIGAGLVVVGIVLALLGLRRRPGARPAPVAGWMPPAPAPSPTASSWAGPPPPPPGPSFPPTAPPPPPPPSSWGAPPG